MKGTSRVFLFVAFLVLTCTFSFADEAPVFSLSFLVPEMVSLDGFFGLAYALGEGVEAAKEALLETGAASAGVTGAEVWRLDLSARWPVVGGLGLILNTGGGPAAFSIIAFDAAGTPAEGRMFTSLVLDAALLASFSWSLKTGAVGAAAGPFLGLHPAGGKIVLKSDGVISTHTVPADQVSPASLGGMLHIHYSFPAGPGFINGGMRCSYRYFSVKGMVSDETLYVHGITPSLSAGYSLKVR